MNFINGIHIYRNKKGAICIKSSKKYTWEVPKKLEKENINQGDIVLVSCKKNGKAPVIVLNIFESDDKNLRHKKVIKVLEKNKK